MTKQHKVTQAYVSPTESETTWIISVHFLTEITHSRWSNQICWFVCDCLSPFKNWLHSCWIMHLIYYATKWHHCISACLEFFYFFSSSFSVWLLIFIYLHSFCGLQACMSGSLQKYIINCLAQCEKRQTVLLVTPGSSYLLNSFFHVLQWNVHILCNCVKNFPVTTTHLATSHTSSRSHSFLMNVPLLHFCLAGPSSFYYLCLVFARISMAWGALTPSGPCSCSVASAIMALCLNWCSVSKCTSAWYKNKR